MDINKLLSKIFGNKSTRDMKEIQPWVEKIKKVEPSIQALDNDQLRAKTKELKKQVQDSAEDLKKEVAGLKEKINDTPIEDRAPIFDKIDKLEKEILDRYDKELDVILPEAFAIVRETARRFAQNEEIEVTATDFDRELADRKSVV